MAIFSSKYPLLGAAAAVALIAAQPGPAMADTAGPIFGITYIEALPADAQVASTQLKAAAKASRKAPGNLGYVVLVREHEKSQFAILEAWSDQQAMDADAAAQPVKDAFTALLPYLKAPIDRRPQTPMMVDASRLKTALTPSSGHVFVITHVDIQPAFKDQGMATVRKFDTDNQTTRGALEFDLTQQTNRLNHISLIEVWGNKTVQVAHDAAPGTIAFRNAVLPLSGAPFDERIYNPLP
jgi:quinol monooxygenase YgiN